MEPSHLVPPCSHKRYLKEGQMSPTPECFLFETPLRLFFPFQCLPDVVRESRCAFGYPERPHLAIPTMHAAVAIILSCLYLITFNLTAHTFSLHVRIRFSIKRVSVCLFSCVFSFICSNAPSLVLCHFLGRSSGTNG